jgi:membrane protein YdbS with pleckstrin-like domain
VAEASVNELLIWPALSAGIVVVVVLIGVVGLTKRLVRRRRSIRRGNLKSRLFK